MKRALFVLALLFAAPAIAAHYPIHKLHTMVSQPGQGEVSFLLDVAHWMRTWTDKTGFEACAWIARDQVQYGVVITTFDAHVGCRLDDDAIPDGMHSIRQTIHSHPQAGGRYTNERDNILANMPLDRRVWNVSPDAAPDNFSPMDYRSGFAGYLVGAHGLYYQHGKGTQALVASFSSE